MRLTTVKRTAPQRERKYLTLTSSPPKTNLLSSDPSVPPADGSEFFTTLPNEVLQDIVAESDLIAYHSVRLSSKALRTRLPDPPLMSQAEYIQFQRQLEVHSSRRLKHLYCSSCNTFKRPTPSKTTFTDAQAVQNHTGRRLCLDCGIANGHYDKRDVVIKKKKLFLCGGCKLLLAHEKEEKAVTIVVFTTAYPYHDNGWGRAAEITIDSGGKRWCKPRRAAIANLGASGAVSVKQIDIP